MYYYYYEYGSTVALPGTAPLRTGPVYSHGFSPFPIIPHFGYRVSFPLKEGGMLADLVSSVLGHLPLLKEGGMLADLESTPVLTGATFISYNRSVYQRRVEIDVLRGAFPQNIHVVYGGFSVVLRDVKLPVGPWGSNWALADLEPRWLTGISFMNWRDPSCLKLDRAAAARLDARAAYSQGSLPTGPALCTFLVRCASPLELLLSCT